MEWRRKPKARTKEHTLAEEEGGLDDDVDPKGPPWPLPAAISGGKGVRACAPVSHLWGEDE